MLKSLFEWFDNHSGSYWVLAGLASLLLVSRILWIVRAEAAPSTRPYRPSWVDGIVLFLFLLAGRWPFLLAANEYNPDESQLIAGALTLARDPVFWRAVDGTTSGPLNFYVLLPWHWIGAPLDYFTARLTGLLLVWGALCLCLRTLSNAFNRAPAWLGVLPAAALFATMTYPDLIHYSSEHLSLFLVALSVWLLAVRNPGEHRRLWAGCFVAGVAPWAKLQVTPLSVILIAWGLWQTWREIPQGTARVPHLLGTLLAAAAPTLLAFGLVTATGQLETAWRRYFLVNLLYVSETRPLRVALADMFSLAQRDGRMPLFLATTAILVLLAAGWLAIRRVRPPALLVPALALTLAAALAVIVPHREFLHYTLLLPIPLTILVGTLTGGVWQSLATGRARWVLAGALFLAGSVPVATRCFQSLPEPCGMLVFHWRHPRTSAAMIVHALSRPSDTLAVWGWANHLYVETGLPQATRDPHSVWAIFPNPQRDYHRECYLADLRRHQPAVFVDAVGPDAFALQDRRAQAHESFPALDAYIRENYVLVTDLGEARIYSRRGLDTLAKLDARRINELLERGRWRARLQSSPPPVTSLAQLPRRFIANQEVIMLLPPAAIDWALDDDAREVMIEYGVDPMAHANGTSDGVELVLELTHEGQTRGFYRRLLDPWRQSNDRGPQKAVVPLPPFAPGSHLVVRSSPGPRGDTAWDWLYFANLRFQHNPTFLAQQFPNFNRVPDSVDAHNCNVIIEGNEYLFFMHAPGALTYVLHGGESRLRFGFGFLAGAYSNGGRTDGAVYRVELERTGEAPRVVFERRLDPLNTTADQGRQLADFALPATRASDRLTLRITSGPRENAAWDWTYLCQFQIE